MACRVDGRTIVLSGDVGDMGGWYFDDDERGFTSSDVIAALAQVGDANDVTIRLNSGGGIATEGSAIHAALARHKGRKVVIVEGIAASAASVLAMAGDEVVMSLGALLMIHDPSGFTVGTIVDHQQQINALTALGDAMASIYAAKSGQDQGACRADMQAELWMTADQAVSKGYADRVEGVGDASAVPTEPAPFDYTAYRHAPPRMVALARARRWDRATSKSTPTANAASETPDQEPAVATEAEIQARIDAAVVAERDKHVGTLVVSAREDGSAAATAATAATAPVPAAQPATSRAQVAEIARLCNEGGVPAMTASLLAEGATVEQAKARIASAGQITEMVALARRQNPAVPENLAATMLAEGKNVEQARAALFDQLVGQSEAAPVASYHRAGAGGADRAGVTDARARSKANMVAQLKRQGLLPATEV